VLEYDPFSGGDAEENKNEKDDKASNDDDGGGFGAQGVGEQKAFNPRKVFISQVQFIHS